jgi:hypothetical protein
MSVAPPEAPADAPADAGVEAAGAADPAAEGAVELPLDEQAANTKLATTRRPAIRVTFLCVDNNPSSSCLREFPDSKTVGGLLPRDERSAHPPPVWRTAARAAWSSRALDSPLRAGVKRLDKNC